MANGIVVNRSTESLGIMRAIGAVLAIALSLAAQCALATNETLHFRLTSSGEIEAVVVGDFCGSTFGAPIGVSIIGTSITITPGIPILIGAPCGPTTPRYEVIANLGVLSAPLYSVTWGPLSASLSPSSLAAIPMLSDFSLLTMALLIVLLGMRSARRTPTREPDDA